MNFLPQAVAWLEESAKSWTQSSRKVYANAILGELRRLNDEVDTHVSERRKAEELRKRERAEHLALGKELDELKNELERERQESSSTRTGLETRLGTTAEKLQVAENTLKDVHYALLKQPELTREDIASVITSVVTPYHEGEKP